MRYVKVRSRHESIFGHMGCVINQEKFAQNILEGAVSKQIYPKGDAGLEKVKNY